MKEEYDERLNGRDSQTKVIYDHSTLKVDFRLRVDQTKPISILKWLSERVGINEMTWIWTRLQNSAKTQ